MELINFMASENGRAFRIVVGTLLIVVALALWHGWVAAFVSLVGVVFIGVGVFDVCLLAPLFGRPVSGKKIRHEA